MADEKKDDLKKSYSFFEKDGAYFRRDDGMGYQSVDDVLVDGAWKPYQGDRFGAAMYGDKIEEAELPL